MNSMLRFKYISFIAFLFVLAGCAKNNPLPTWVIISKFSLEDNPTLSEGVLTENITDGWVYVNDKFIGVFELPCKLPVLQEGQNLKIAVYPTVRMNGISATKVQHPYLDPHVAYLNFVSGDSTFVNPVTRYSSGTQFWIEDFQSGSIKLTNGIDNTASLSQMIDPDDANNKFAKILLTEAQSHWSMYTSDALSLAGRRTILEFDYCNTANISTTVIAGKADATIVDHPHVRANAQDAATMKWKKIYIDITETVNLSQGYLFWQGFKASLTSGRTEDVVMIDNIKVVYR